MENSSDNSIRGSMRQTLFFSIIFLSGITQICGLNSLIGDPGRPLDETIEQTLTVEVVNLRISHIDQMSQVFVPAGDFKMGSEIENNINEFPEHIVYLDAFWIDQTEVTNDQYQQCVIAGACSPPSDFSNYQRADYYNNKEYESFPVSFVSWFQAKEYCEWAGRRLPTEAEWEKASRGTEGFDYPWGNEAPSYELLNYKGTAGQKNPLAGTTKVGSYKHGASPYGAMDMAGNVNEWVADWYDQYFYEQSPYSNPQGPPDGDRRVVRGGDWDTYDSVIRSSYRLSAYPDFESSNIGFRCVESVLE